jgi:hypothetical protein
VVFNLLIGSWFYFVGLVLNFLFFNSHFPVTALGRDLFSGVYLNKLLFLWCPVLRTTEFKGSTRLGASLPQERNRAQLPKCCALKN